ncbi:MAG: hypothetical protein IIC90_12050 [Chloroflexi bacterium]|nr:hypothetical protein [Chloroflexota bacterium]
MSTTDLDELKQRYQTANDTVLKVEREFERAEDERKRLHGELEGMDFDVTSPIAPQIEARKEQLLGTLTDIETVLGGIDADRSEDRSDRSDGN